MPEADPQPARRRMACQGCGTEAALPPWEPGAPPPSAPPPADLMICIHCTTISQWTRDGAARPVLGMARVQAIGSNPELARAVFDRHERLAIDPRSDRRPPHLKAEHELFGPMAGPLFWEMAEARRGKEPS